MPEICARPQCGYDLAIAVHPKNPNVVYAAIEAADGKGGIFRSEDKGATWERRNEFDQGAMYYGRVVADPKNVNRIFVMGVNLRESSATSKMPKRSPNFCATIQGSSGSTTSDFPTAPTTLLRKNIWVVARAP